MLGFSNIPFWNCHMKWTLKIYGIPLRHFFSQIQLRDTVLRIVCKLFIIDKYIFHSLVAGGSMLSFLTNWKSNQQIKKKLKNTMACSTLYLSSYFCMSVIRNQDQIRKNCNLALIVKNPWLKLRVKGWYLHIANIL